MFSNYVYHASVSETFKAHCYDMALEVKAMINDTKGAVIDIAANDGCLLDQFKRAGFSWLSAVEPAKNLALECEAKGYYTHNQYWNYSTPVPRASVITATNVLAHVDDLNDFVSAIFHHLPRCAKGICIIEVPYLINLINNNQFDTIYHEHLSYFLLRPLKLLFERCNLRIFKVKQVPIHGGSLRIYASRKTYVTHEYTEGYQPTGSKEDRNHEVRVEKDMEPLLPEDGSVQATLDLERSLGFYDKEKYEVYFDDINLLRLSLLSMLVGLKGKKVAAYGASAKGISLLNYCLINNSLIHSIVDETPDKQGKWTPGSKIPIMPFSEFERIKPDYILLLAWNFAPELIAKTKHLGAKYIVPIPEVKIL